MMGGRNIHDDLERIQFLKLLGAFPKKMISSARRVCYELVMRKLDSVAGKIHQTDARSFMSELPEGSVDLIVCDGPYAVTTHDWDNVADIQNFNLELLKSFSRLLKPGGAAYLFGKPDCIDFIDYRSFLTLQSKIVWYQPSRLAQGRISYTSVCRLRNQCGLLPYCRRAKGQSCQPQRIFRKCFRVCDQRQRRGRDFNSSPFGINHLAVLLRPFDGESNVRNLICSVGRIGPPGR